MDRPYIKPNPVITNGLMTGNITSAVTVLAQKTGLSYDVAWTGTPTGTLTVQVSNTVVIGSDGTASGGNWSTFTATVPTITGSAGNGMINLTGLQVYAVRLLYTFSGGTGTLNAVVCSKVQ